MTDPVDINNDARPLERRYPIPRPDADSGAFQPTRAVSGLVGRGTSTTSSSSTVTSCSSSDTTGVCERYSSNNTTLPIVLGVLIPLAVAFAVLYYLHRRHVKKLRREDAEDKHGSLDFGFVTGAGGDDKKQKKNNNKKFKMKKNKHNKGQKGDAPPEMSIAETAKAIRGGRGMSMDMGLSSPYVLPVGIQESQDSLHSLSRSLKMGDDKYGRTNFVPDDGSIRTPSQLKRTRDDSSSNGSSGKTNFDGQSTKGLLPADAAKSGSDKLGPNKPQHQPSSSLLVPAGPDGRASIVSTASSNVRAFRKSNDYLAAYIRGGISPRKKTPETTATNIELEAVPPTVTISHDEDSQAAAATTTATLPEVNVFNTNGEIEDGAWNSDSGYDSYASHYTPFPGHDSQQLDGYNRQYWEGQGDGEQYDDEWIDYYDPRVAYRGMEEYYYEDYNTDPRWLSMGMRPLPPDDPSENPEQRANRIRSFYKEYFDESSRGHYGGSEFGYYDYPPGNGRPGRRKRATFSNGTSGRYGLAGRAPAKKRAPPPKALNIIPTPAKLKDDTYIVDKSIDFAPPLRAVMQRSGTPDSGRGGSVPFSPTVRAHVPLVSSYDDLAVMPSPHLLRRSGTFTSLDFAPPRFRARQEPSPSDSGSVRSARSGTSLSAHRAIKAGAYRVSRIPKEVVGTTGEIGTALKPKWDMNR